MGENARGEGETRSALIDEERVNWARDKDPVHPDR
jgi:hypothetical protein